MKRYSSNLSAGLVSFMAMSAACVGGAHAAPLLASAPDGDHTGMQLSFELAMAAAAQTEATDAASQTAKSQTAAKDTQADKPGPDGLLPGGAYVEANQVETLTQDQYVANGDVEMRFKNRTIRADQVQFNAQTGVTVATGHTQTFNDDGTVQFADSITYDDTMKSGVSYNFAAISRDNAKVFARKVEQIDPDTNELTNVIYTPCDLCVSHGQTEEPSWSIEASRVTQRKDKKMVYYQNAFLKLHGVPVMYAPYMWTPDPTLDRASGFLEPKIAFTKKRGFSYEQPYLWSISPYQQLIVSPQLNTGVAPLLNLDYSRHFYSGLLHIRGGVTNESFFDNNGDKIGPAEIRDYILADGAFKINDNWRWNFTAQHVKDPSGNPDGDYANFFERYNIDDAFEKVGDFSVDSRQLISQINLIRQAPNAYFAVTMASFENLAIAGYIDPTSTPQTYLQPYAASSDYYPVIAPMVEAYWSPRSRILGGQLTFSLNALGLQHKRQTAAQLASIFSNYDSASDPAIDTTGNFDTSRLSAGISYEGSMTTSGGLRWGPLLDLRHDEYRINDLLASGDKVSISRDLATVGFQTSYPLFKKFKTFDWIIEPIAQVAVSPDAQEDPYQPNEDSQSVEFDDTTLFAFNKSPGFDIYESGARLNLGLRTQFLFQSGLDIQALVGRTLRDKTEQQFLNAVTYSGKTYYYDPSGLASKSSDWIVDASFDTGHSINGYTRMRFDSDSLRLVQGEYGLSIIKTQAKMTLRYIFNDVLPTPKLGANGDLVRFGDNYRDLQLYGQYFFTKNWGVGARLDRDMITDSWKRSTVSLIYRNDCIQYTFTYRRDDTAASRNNGRPSSAFLFSLNFPTFGSSRKTPSDIR